MDCDAIRDKAGITNSVKSLLPFQLIQKSRLAYFYHIPFNNYTRILPYIHVSSFFLSDSNCSHVQEVALRLERDGESEGEMD